MNEDQYKFTKQDCIGCREYCELQQENASLQSALSLSRQKYNNDKQRYRRKYKKEHDILVELEKWLEEKINSPKLSLIEIITFKRCLEELQELKEGKK